MPIYEFFCDNCRTIFKFFSKKVNTNKTPVCPKCKMTEMKRQISSFSLTGQADKNNDMEKLPFDESKIEKAVTTLAAESEKIDENNTKQAADLMRKFSNMTGMKLGNGMENVLARMEAGEDPEKIEKEMGSIVDKEDPFIFPEKKSKIKDNQRIFPVSKDNTLYEL